MPVTYDFAPALGHPDPAHRDIARALADRAEVVFAAARSIHADPELAFAEHHALDTVVGPLEEAGFRIERGVGDLATAFRASIGQGSLDAALCVEYDALPGIGHGCGHNLIAGASLGAALALAPVAQDPANDLTLQVIGTPAEEHGGGKQLSIEAGVFDGVDLALMTHAAPETATYDPIGSTSTAVGRWQTVYTGRGAHAAADPTAGINASDAAIIAQVALGLLRQQVADGERLNAITREAGAVTNIIAERSVIEWECRALTMEAFADLRERILRCFEAGAVATGCSWEVRAVEPVYEPLLQDRTLGELWNEGMAVLGRPLAGGLGVMSGSTDMGNVSRRLPSLHPFVGITGVHCALHTQDFADAANTEEAYRLMFDAALTMAWAIHGVATRPERRAAVLEARARLAEATGAHG
jgi:amidohydrolase